MDTNKNSKKIIVFGLILLMIAGLIVVALKGFQVSLLFGKHEAIELKVDKKVDMAIVKQICDDVFQEKKYVLKELEVFGDSFQINTKAITDEEKNNLISQVNEKFETQKTVEDLRIRSVSNQRIRDVIKPYIFPMITVFVIVSIYAWIRFRTIHGLKIVWGYLWKIVVTELVLLSLIAILRIPVDEIVIFLGMLVALGGLVYFLAQAEKKLAKQEALHENE